MESRRGYSDVEENPFLTVVMPVRNEERFIEETLGQLLDQDYPDDSYEIIVADGGSDDNTRQIITNISKDFPQVVLMDNLGLRSSAGRNVGFINGKGSIFLVVDGHCHIPSRQLFRDTVELIYDKQVDCLGRPQPLTPPGLTCFQLAVAHARSSCLGHGGGSMIFGDYEGYASPVSNGATYTRRVFDQVGYVDENFDAAEDVEFNYRVEKSGLRSYTSPKLTVEYYPRETIKGLFRQMLRYGKGRCQFVGKHKETLSVNQLIPAGFVLGLFALLFLAGFSSLFSQVKPLFVGLFCLYSFYLILITAESVRLSQKHGKKYMIYYPIIFFIIHSGLGVGFLRQALKS
jgi:glycosyltransferase involved in cell wall biosynthesis